MITLLDLFVVFAFSVFIAKTLWFYHSGHRIDYRHNLDGVSLMDAVQDGLFVCSQCNCVDHAALAEPDHRWLCSKCNPDKEYHGQFELVPYNPERDIVINRPNGLSV